MGSASGEDVRAEPAAGQPAALAVEASEADRLVLLVPASPDRLSVLRRRLKHFLAARGVRDGDLFDLVVAVSEAAANAIEHPVRPTEAVICVVVEVHGDVVEVTVRDSGRWRRPARSAVRGRGLAMMAALAEVDVRCEVDGTTIALRRRLARSLPSAS